MAIKYLSISLSRFDSKDNVSRIESIYCIRLFNRKLFTSLSFEELVSQI